MLFCGSKQLFFCRIALAVFACLGASVAQAQTSLAWKFRAGQKLNYSMEQKMETTMSVMGTDVTTKMTQAMEMVWTIRGVDGDGKWDLSQKIKRMRYTMESPYGVVEYNSDKGEIPEGPVGKTLGPIFDALIGGELSLKMDSQGEFTDVKLPQKLEDVLRKTPSSVQFGFSEDSMKQMLSQSGVVFPKGRVSKGQTWDKKIQLKMPAGQMHIDSIFDYQGGVTKGDRNLEKIGLKSSIAIETDPNSPVEVALKTQDADGIILFDKAAGRLVESNLRQSLVMEVVAMGQVIVQTLNQSVTTKLEDEK